MNDKKYVQVRFRMPIEDFEVYESEAKELEKQHGIKSSGTDRVRAEAIKQAKAKKKLLPVEDDINDVMAVFRNME